MERQVQVFGPAYLDRVLRVDRPLVDPEAGPPLDQSVEGTWGFGEGLSLVDPGGGRINVELPRDWPGPCGRVLLSRPLPGLSPPGKRSVRARSWQDELGGMGAGFAAALGGTLVSALGPEDDATSRAVEQRLAAAGIRHRPIRVPGRSADWTLLVTSGEFGDKLPIGFRGCHAALGSLEPWCGQPCEVRVVAALPNRLAEQALRGPGAAVRVFAPAIRNVLDADPPVARFAEAIDVLACNRREWEGMPDREEVFWRISVLAVTDGSAGSIVRFTTPQGEAAQVRTPAFPRSRPPLDTNRAGEAYAAALIAALLDGGWSPRGGVADESLVRRAAIRASTAAALVLDRLEFDFPTPAEIDAALRAGRVAEAERRARAGRDRSRYNAAGPAGKGRQEFGSCP